MNELEYKPLISKLVEQFKKSTPDDEEELIAGFENYLYTIVRKMKEAKHDSTKEGKQRIEILLNRITKNLSMTNLETKKSRILVDESFEEIRKISDNVFETALRQLESNATTNIDINVEEKIEKIIQLLEEVKSFNKEQAQMLVSETMLDLQFIQNPKTDIKSLRLAHIQTAMKNREDSAKKEVKEER